MFKPITLGLCVAAGLFASIARAEEAPVLIKFSHVVAENTPKGRGALLFKKLVEERLAGQVRVEVYPNSTLFDEPNEVEALLRDEVQLLAPSITNLASYSRRLELFDLPFLFDDLEAVKRFQSRRSSQELLSSMAGHGITGLTYWNNGMKQLSANRALRTPGDASGLTFRIQNSEIVASQFDLIGAQTLKVPYSQSYQVIHDGKAQGAENPWSNITGQQLHTVQPYITESNHGVLSYMLITSTHFWHSLPFQVRSELETIIGEVTQVVNAEAEAINQRERDRIMAAGTSELVSLDDSQKQAWRQAMIPLYKTYEDVIGADLIRAAQVVNR